MAKTDRENRGRGRNSDSSRRTESSEEKKSGRSAYKAKRSFTRNKGFREKEKDDSRKRGAAREDGDRGWGDRKKTFDKPAYRDRPFKRPSRGDDDKPAKSYKQREERSGRDEDRPFKRDRDARNNRSEERGDRDRPKRNFSRDKESGENDRPRRTFNKDDNRGERERPKRKFSGDEERESRPSRFGNEREGKKDRPYGNDDRRERPRRDDDRNSSKRHDGGDEYAPRRVKHDEFESGDSFKKQRSGEKKKPGHANRNPENEGLIRLNKYLANAGLASRREADTLIQSGAVKVNGVVVDQLGYKIKPGDRVTYGDESVKGERKVYLLLNKPKDYITTVDDPRERKTVMELIQGACRERVYPVGRLDRNTTGVLLFTNDGELTTKLTHPKFNVKKVYHVTLDKNLKTTDFQALVDGIELEDGPAKADDLAFVGEGKREVGIEIHSGRNRIVRRMFEHMGYSVIKLDRVVFAGLTKKDLPRGKHRFLTAKEISFLKMIG